MYVYLSRWKRKYMSNISFSPSYTRSKLPVSIAFPTFMFLHVGSCPLFLQPMLKSLHFPDYLIETVMMMKVVKSGPMRINVLLIQYGWLRIVDVPVRNVTELLSLHYLQSHVKTGKIIKFDSEYIYLFFN